MFRTDTGIVKSCGNGVNGCDLTVFILAEIGLHPVEDADSAGIDGCRRFKGVNASACRFAANQTNARIFDEMIEAADGVGASAHTGDNGIGQPAFFLKDLLFDFFGNHRLKITDDGRERMGSHYRTEAVVGIGNSGSPLSHCLGNCIL